VVEAFACVPFLEFTQVKTCAKVVTLASDHCSAGFFGKILEDVSQ
jgi:hypothetical protein